MDIKALQADFRGEILTPGSAEYEAVPQSLERDDRSQTGRHRALQRAGGRQGRGPICGRPGHPSSDPRRWAQCGWSRDD